MERSLPELEQLIRDVDAELGKLIPKVGLIFMGFDEYARRISQERGSLGARVSEIVAIRERLQGMEAKLVKERATVALTSVSSKNYMSLRDEMVCTERSVSETNKLLKSVHRKYGWELNSHLVFLEGHVPVNMNHHYSLRTLLLERYRSLQIRRCEEKIGLDTASLRAFAEACGEINRQEQATPQEEVPPPPVPPAEHFDFLVQMNWVP